MRYLNTGKFAKLCGVKKDTLLFYDKEGLLKPKYISDNGYRHYDVGQYFEFDMISMLKDTGTSLKEIKHHFSSVDPAKFLELLEEKKQELKEEQKRLAYRRQTLEDITRLGREALDEPYDTVEIMELDEERLELIPADLEMQKTTAGWAMMFAEHSNYFANQKRYPRKIFGALVLGKDISPEGWFINSFFFKASRHTPKSALHTQPKGRYAVLMHRGFEESHQNAYAELLATIKRRSLKVAGNMYAYDMVSYIISGTLDDYILKYCVQVE